jgi:anaerobic magnesium-protoporphyrin IX monomethyl ester cyclase
MSDILLVNPPYRTITSRLGVGHQVPLGLILVGGALRQAGYPVKLIDAERHPMSDRALADAVAASRARVVLTGHAGSTPAHPICLRMLRAIKARCPDVTCVYGGVYPTYHARAIIDHEPAVDVVVRGEGEATAVDLLAALQRNPAADQLDGVTSIAFRRHDGKSVLTADRPPIRDLDAFARGWELLDDRWDDYRCFGLGRAAIVQFSRGCPHRCSYCGQHDFWRKWRHRDPVKVADEVEWLAREHRVRFVTLADENPTTSPQLWRALLEQLAARNTGVKLFATLRATDIVRDQAILPLYHKAGIQYVLMGMESTDQETIRQINKGSTTRHDYLACQLLKQNRIFSIIGHVVGFGPETAATFRTARRQLARYDGDYLNAMYVCPHDWTPFAHHAGNRKIIRTDQSKWDYRHQVLAQDTMSPLGLFLRVKWIELAFHLRPTRLRRILFEPEPARRRQWTWSALHTAAVWFAEIVEFAAWMLRHPLTALKAGQPASTRAQETPPFKPPALAPVPLPPASAPPRQPQPLPQPRLKPQPAS